MALNDRSDAWEQLLAAVATWSCVYFLIYWSRPKHYPCFSEIGHSLTFFLLLSSTIWKNSLMMCESSSIREYIGEGRSKNYNWYVSKNGGGKKMRSEAHTDYNYNNLKFSADVTVHRGCSRKKIQRATRRLNRVRDGRRWRKMQVE
jgi:hypothetical protein